jgi:DNA-directed RNA polymerase subunit F
MPESVEELRVFFPRHRLIEPEKLQEMLKLLDEYRKKKEK